MTTTFTRTPSSAQLIAAEAEDDRAVGNALSSLESFDRCDTNGSLSQWGSERMAEVHRLQAELYRNGEIAEFEALFDIEGNLVPAVIFSGTYGMSWRLLAPREGQKTFFTPSADAKDTRRIAKDAAKGFYVGTIACPAKVKLGGSSVTSVRAIIYPKQYGFSNDVEIIDNGL